MRLSTTYAFRAPFYVYRYCGQISDLPCYQVYFWTTIRKNRSKYNLTRGISEDAVTSILLHDVIVGKDPQKAESSLLKLPGLRKFMDKLKSDREKDDFRRHMRKYINIWLPDCPFEVSTTNRYTIVTQEAAATARRFIKKGDTIKYLCGNLVSMTSEEEKDLDLTRRDFSIVMSSRKKTPSLFLGPARFANHDCEANAKLVTRGSEGMQVVAVRDIHFDEEITVTYGEDYFGIENCECLCKSCEDSGRNGWAERKSNATPTGTGTPLTVDGEVSAGPYSFRRKRKYDSFASASMTPDVEDLGSVKRSKTTSAISSLAYDSERLAASHAQAVSIKMENLGPTLGHEVVNTKSQNVSDEVRSLRDREPQTITNGPEACILPIFVEDGNKVDVVAIKNSHDQHHRRRDMDEACATKRFGGEHLSPRLDLPTTNGPSKDSKIQKGSDAVSTIPRKRGRPRKVIPPPAAIQPAKSEISNTSSDADSVFDNDNPRNSSLATTPSASLDAGSDWKSQVGDTGIRSDSELSDLSENEFLDDQHLTIIRRPRKRKAISRKRKVVPTIEMEVPTNRYPGDYVRTPLLLGEAYSRWVDCSTCDACWVQPNGYYTRKECPRCERHSKLYGYQWPKTEKQGKGDDKERVMDHRTVHRFVKPEEEATVKKRGRGLVRGESGVSSRGQSERQESVMDGSRSTVRKSDRRRSSYLASC